MPEFTDSDAEDGDEVEVRIFQFGPSDEHVMAAEEFRRSVDRFYREVKPEHLFTFFRLMNLIGTPGAAERLAMFHAGKASVFLKEIHGYCTNCGEPHDEDEHILGPKEAAEGSAEKDNKNAEEDLNLNIGELMNKYRVYKLETSVIDAYLCADCSTEFPTMEFRAAQGLQCPGCLAKGRLGGEADS